MKFITKILGTAAVGLVLLATAPAAHAQININIGPPSWGPAVPAGQQYYYIPETNGFYDVPARQYVVQRDGRWIRSSTLAGYNTANFHPVIVDYVGAEPWSRYDEYRGKYGKKRNPSNGGLPPGQAKKLYRRGNGNGNGNGQYDDRRYERRDDDRDGYNNDRRHYERRDDDDNGNGKYKDKDKGKGKGKKDKD